MVAGPAWYRQGRPAVTADDNRVYRDAARWLRETDTGDRDRIRLVTDGVLWLDAVDAGYRPGTGVIWHYKLDQDPAVTKTLPHGWKDIDYVVSTPALRGEREHLPTLRALSRTAPRSPPSGRAAAGSTSSGSAPPADPEGPPPIEGGPLCRTPSCRTARADLAGTRPARTRLLLTALLLFTAAVGLGPLGAQRADAASNLVRNPGLEVLDGPSRFPQCFEKSGWGDNDFSFAVTDDAHSGSRAVRIQLTRRADGDRKTMMLENSCAPQVTPDHQYDLSFWYRSSTPDVAFTLFRHDTAQGWVYWTDLKTLPPSAAWTRTEVRTPVIPPNTDRITWGGALYGVGTLTTDDYAMTDATVPAEPDPCATGGTGPECRGRWTVQTADAPVRAIHSVLLHTGKVLLIAGSGNDQDAFRAGTFKTSLFDPATGGYTDIPTPEDFFCAGHVQLPDGRVLVVGGNKDYAAPDGSVGYKGLKSSYVFDPARNTYVRVNDMLAGHWYPSATAMGNGDVVALGGLGEDSSGTVVNEHFSYARNKWLPMGEAKQAWSFWGLYPSMILLQDGRLFYTGSHVFGNGLPGTGASVYDYDAGTISEVPGLRKKDERDQSMSVLLPPAQDQKVLTMGGGHHVVAPDAHRLTDLIDLKAASPQYVPGPDLPQGHYADGSPQTGAQGKVYLSAVILPDGKVLGTGGALHTYREDPVFEASPVRPGDQHLPGRPGHRPGPAHLPLLLHAAAGRLGAQHRQQPR